MGNRLASSALVLVSVALVAAACSSSDGDSKTTTPIDAGGQPDWSIPIADAAPETGVDAGPDGKKACDLLSASVLPTQTQVVQMPANSHPLAQAPTPAGGTVVDGTYRLASVNTYFDGGGSTPGGRTRGTLELKSGLWESASIDYDVSNMPVNTSTGGGAYVVKATEMGPAPGPPGGPTSPGCGSGQFFGGPSGGLSGIGYTATPGGITFIRPNLPNTVIIVAAYTKDP